MLPLFTTVLRAQVPYILIAGTPEFVKTLAAPEENNARFISRPHYQFMKEFGVALREYPRMHGKGAVILTHTVNEE